MTQTCQLALDLIAWRSKQGTDATIPGGDAARGEGDTNPYLSVDPAPSCGVGGGEVEGGEGGGLARDATPEEMGKRLRDQERSLFERYRCSLRRVVFFVLHFFFFFLLRMHCG